MLSRLKLTDADGRVSLTNLSVYIVLAAFAYCTARHAQVDLTSLGSLLTALSAYRVKAHQADRREQRDYAALQAQLADTKRALDLAAKAAPARAAAIAAALPRGLQP